MEKTITAASSSLCSLGIFSEALWKFNVQRLSALTELTLTLIAEGNPVEAIFTHCTRLQSLTILEGPSHKFPRLAEILHAHPSALPHLIAFRLYLATVEQGVMETIPAFLRTKPLLERFELGHRWEACLLDMAEPMLQVLSDLPCLRILGLKLGRGSLGRGALRPIQLQHFAQRIPPQITALSLWVDTRCLSKLREEDCTQFVWTLRSDSALRLHANYYCFRLASCSAPRAALLSLHTHLVGFRLLCLRRRAEARPLCPPPSICGAHRL